jgi:hypothetical protein
MNLNNGSHKQPARQARGGGSGSFAAGGDDVSPGKRDEAVMEAEIVIMLYRRGYELSEAVNRKS